MPDARLLPMKYVLKTATPLLLSVLFGSALCAQTIPSKPFTAAFYNVENLFDTVDDPTVNDDEFLPDTPKKWTIQRYQQKMSDLAGVIAAIPGKGLPDILGLSEVENRTVLLDLVKEQDINLAAYMLVHKDSPDRRGIDVALLYKPDRFKLLHEDFFTAPLVTTGNPTRDVLYAKGLVEGNDTLHVFVNHWPSRYGGAEKSAPNRNAIAALVRYRIDSLQHAQPDCKILVMGDFNDNPTNESMAEILEGATMPNQTDKPLFNMHAAAWSRGEGTFNYRGDWSMLDQILVSWSLLNATTGLNIKPDSGGIVREPWMMYTDKDGVEFPSKTYGGSRYYKGISDHLPVYVEMGFFR